MRLVPIEYVKPGDILGKTIYDINGIALLKYGVILENNTINKLKDLKIYSLYIIDEYSTEEIEDVIKPELRQKAIMIVKEAVYNMKKITVADKYSGKDEKYLNNISSIVENIMDDVLNNKDLVLSLVDIRSMDNYIFAHSVNVAVISLILGSKLKLPKSKLGYLCMGALIHDIGKTFISTEILNKEKLSYEESKLIEQHPIVGYKYISDTYNLSSFVKLIVLEHHERPNGLGTPNGLKDEEINELSKIVSIADAYDNLSTDRPNKRAMFPSDVLEYLMSNSGKLFDHHMVEVFCRIVVPFSIGTIVKLSNNDIAIVKETVKNYPLRPIVEVIESDNKELIGQKINLIENLSITITEIKYEI